ncbi:MAG: restriction endonuclease subunit S [Nitrospirota bacterium]
MNKQNWALKRFDSFAFNITERVEPGNTTLDKYIGLEHLDSSKIKIERCGKPDEVIGTKLRVYKGDIIFGKRRAYQRKAATVEFDAICSAHSMVLRPNETLILKSLFPFFLHTDLFMKRAVEISEGSLSPTIKWKTLARQEFLLPPLSEQVQIAELFQSIETAIKQAEQQEENLNALQKSLSNGLATKEPVFGNLLDKNNCKPINFGGIADCIERHDKQKKDVSRFIGLEHIEPDNLKIAIWGNIEDGTTFTKRFSKGDVLFGKRRAYLRKVAVADFDGICSSDILVFRAKDKVVLPALLPFYVSSEPFIQHAISTSAGSLSPRTKWRDLSSFEISIPDLKTQQEIVSVLDSIIDMIEQIKTQIQTLRNLKQKLLNEILG